jgi:two-component system chemotaxis sensor kinase CheA
LRIDELPQDGPAPPPGVPVQSFVLFDAASGQRFALPLASLARVEALAPDRVERVGAREFFSHRGRSVPLIHLHEALDVGARGDPAEERLALIPRASRRALGIAAARIVDTVVSDARPDPELLRAPGILGAARLQERLTLFLDPAALAEAAGV